jgi:autotransporter-associated beta strand protein
VTADNSVHLRNSVSGHARLLRSTSRLIIAAALGLGPLALAAPVLAQDITVGSDAELRDAISNATPGATIFLSQNITLESNLPNITRIMDIDGRGHTLSGAGLYRGLTVSNGTIAINNLVIANTVARGGNGGLVESYRDSQGREPYNGGTGGGGAGLGAGLFVDTGAKVILDSVVFQNNSAIGGNGGAFTTENSFASFFSGGSGGGGRFGDGGENRTNGNGGSGGEGGGGDGGSSPGVGQYKASPGQFGGGGGGAGYNLGPAGAGGYGGGGGGRAGGDAGGDGGAGGFGGGAGASTGVGGGGGAGLGGAIFVREGGQIELVDTAVYSGNTVAGGSASNGGAPGKGYGAGIFLGGSGTLTLDFDPGKAPVMSDAIADEKGSSGAGGSWALRKIGTGTTILTGANAYSGGTTVEAGVLQGTTTGLVGNIVNNAVVAFDQATAGDFTGSISGPGKVVKLGAGAVRLTGANSWTGLTSIEGGSLAIGPGGSLAGTDGAIAISNGSFGVDSTSATVTRAIQLGAAAGLSAVKGTLTVDSVVSGGQLNVTGGGTVVLTNTNTFTGIAIADSQLRFTELANLGQAAPIQISGFGTIGASVKDAVTIQNRSVVLSGAGGFFTDNAPIIWEGPISGDGQLWKTGVGVLQLTGTNTYTGGTGILEGTVMVAGDGFLGATGKEVDFYSGSNLQATASFATDRNFKLRNKNNTGVDGSGSFIVNDGVTLTVNGSVRGGKGSPGLTGGFLSKSGPGTLVLTSDQNIFSQLFHNGGLVVGTSASLSGNINLDKSDNPIARSVTFDQDFDGTYALAITGKGNLTKEGTGRLSLTGTSDIQNGTAFEYGTVINNGTLAVNGKLTSSVIVNTGGTLAGSQNVIGTVKLNGGKIAPGNSIGTLTIDGSLDIESGTLEMAVSPTASDQINVIGPDGIITLGVHKLQLDFEPGLYGPRTYTLLSASQEIRGQIDTATAITPPANFTGRAFTTSKEVLLTLTADLGRGLTLSGNQLALTDALDATYNATGKLPANLAGLYGLTGPGLGAALTVATGEVATGLQTSATQMTNGFLNLLLNPFMDGQSDVRIGRQLLSAPSEADGAAQKSAWNLWAAGFYGSDSFDGDTVVGSHDLSNSGQSFVLGLDYRASASTVVGIALGVGGSQWSLDDTLGDGDSTAFQVGIFGITNWGPVYLSGALSFVNQWASTDRTVLAERLQGDIDAQTYGARIEAGYRLTTGIGGVTPYAAGQIQRFYSSDYAESGGAANSFALAYDAQSTSYERTELGLRFDTGTPGGSKQWTFNARAAWAHDWFDQPEMTAAFANLPGTDFVVEGAQRSSNLALLSAGAEVRLARGLSLVARFNSELGDRSTTLSGSGALVFAF